MIPLRLLVIGLPLIAFLLFGYSFALSRERTQNADDAAAVLRLYAALLMFVEIGMLLGFGIWTVFAL